MDVQGDAAKKANIGHLKEFYLQRLAKTEPSAAARLGSQVGFAGGGVAQPQASGQHVARPTIAAGAGKDIEDLEIMCNNCFNLIPATEASTCTGDPSACPLACRHSGGAGGQKPNGIIPLLDHKLQKLRAALEARLQDAGNKVNVMRHLTQLRYHIDTAMKWAPRCSEIGALSDHTVQQVKQLTTTSRVLAPAVYIFSKRIETVVVQKERELRKLAAQSSPAKKHVSSDGAVYAVGRDLENSGGDVCSIVSELDSDCGTQYAETVITQVTQRCNPMTDVGNVQDAMDFLSLKNEGEQRRWFYQQCLNIKQACPDKVKARKTLISDLYARVRAEGIPIESWVAWLRAQLLEDGSAPASPESTRGAPTSPQAWSAPAPPGRLLRERSPLR